MNVGNDVRVFKEQNHEIAAKTIQQEENESVAPILRTENKQSAVLLAKMLWLLRKRQNRPVQNIPTRHPCQNRIKRDSHWK